LHRGSPWRKRFGISRLAPLRPIEATGATYLWLDLAGVKEDAEVTFVADWESGVLFHWALVKVDKAGFEVGQVRGLGWDHEG
jgi:hypothetical protein